MNRNCGKQVAFIESLGLEIALKKVRLLHAWLPETNSANHFLCQRTVAVSTNIICNTEFYQLFLCIYKFSTVFYTIQSWIKLWNNDTNHYRDSLVPAIFRQRKIILVSGFEIDNQRILNPKNI